MFSTRRCAFLGVLAIAFLSACGVSEIARRDTGAGQGSAFRVALLTPGPISDQRWNAGAYAGLTRIRDSLGAQVSHIQTRTPSEFDEKFRQDGAQGYALVFGHGFEDQDAARPVAPAYPRTIFVVTSSTVAAPNFAGNPALSSRIPAAIPSRVDSVWAAIIRGDYRVSSRDLSGRVP